MGGPHVSRMSFTWAMQDTDLQLLDMGEISLGCRFSHTPQGGLASLRPFCIPALNNFQHLPLNEELIEFHLKTGGSSCNSLSSLGLLFAYRLRLLELSSMTSLGIPPIVSSVLMGCSQVDYCSFGSPARCRHGNKRHETWGTS